MAIRIVDKESHEKAFGPSQWHCYMIIHPVTKTPLYVGMTSALGARLNGHSSANSQVKHLLDGLEPEMVVVASFDTKKAALEHEIDLINKLPGLANMERRRRVTGRPRLEEAGDTIEARKPWVAEGISRRTWYSRQAESRKGTK